MWIFCCGMMRSGSTLQYQIVAEIVKSKSLGQSLGWITPDTFNYILPEHYSESDLLVVKTHNYIEQAHDLAKEGKAKFVYSYRDLRDVIVSISHKHEEKVWNCILKGYIESALSDYRRWNCLEPILVSRYEDFSNDISSEVRRISHFLGSYLEESEIIGIAKMFTLDKQRERIHKSDYQSSGIRVGTSVYDPKTLLHPNHINSGRSEQWRSKLSELECFVIESISRQWLLEHNYPLSSTKLEQMIGNHIYYLNKYFIRSHGFVKKFFE